MKDTIIPLYPSSEKVLVRSEGVYLFDSDGRRYIDFESGVWCANLGHGHHAILNVLQQQAQACMHQGYRFRNHISELLSHRLLQLLDFSEGQSVFLSSGSESVNLAITLAMHLTGRRKVLKVSNSYLSAYGHGQMSASNDNLVNLSFNNLDVLNKADFNSAAAFVFEPGGASLDMVCFPDREYITTAFKKAKEAGAFFIVDEVTTGFGRLGDWFGFQFYDVTPDMVAMGKALGNGYPVSALCVNAGVKQSLLQLPFRYAQSHQNDPLGCAIALEVLKQFELSDLITCSKTKGAFFGQKLMRIQCQFPNLVKDVRGRGMMFAIEFFDVVNGEWVAEQLFDRGFVTGYKNNVLRFMPPLTIPTIEIDNLTHAISELLQKYLS